MSLSMFQSARTFKLPPRTDNLTSKELNDDRKQQRDKGCYISLLELGFTNNLGYEMVYGQSFPCWHLYCCDRHLH